MSAASPKYLYQSDWPIIFGTFPTSLRFCHCYLNNELCQSVCWSWREPTGESILNQKFSSKSGSGYASDKLQTQSWVMVFSLLCQTWNKWDFYPVDFIQLFLSWHSQIEMTGIKSQELHSNFDTNPILHFVLTYKVYSFFFIYINDQTWRLVQYRFGMNCFALQMPEIHVLLKTGDMTV